MRLLSKQKTEVVQHALRLAIATWQDQEQEMASGDQFFALIEERGWLLDNITKAESLLVSMATSGLYLKDVPV